MSSVITLSAARPPVYNLPTPRFVQMLMLSRCGRTAVVLALLCLAPSAALAQDGSLRSATIAASSAAAADLVSTYQALKGFKLREMNPVLRPLDHRPGKMVTVGALIVVGGITGWNMTVGRSHPRVAATGLWAMTAFRAYLAIHNYRNQLKAPRR
jgi:hypothetical protein